MKTLNLQQGSPEWLTHRASHFNASDAPAMLGCSPYATRSHLLHALHTGLRPEVDSMTQRRFDEGHRFEALARPLAEQVIGDELSPVVGVMGELSASFDGITMMEDTCFEHKRLNDELRKVFDDVDTMAPKYRDNDGGKALPKHFRVQMEQQLLVSGAERVLFMATEWNDADELVEERFCWYSPDPALRAELVAGWKQFAADLAAYVPQQVAAVVTASPMQSLPAVSVRMDGALKVIDNLDVFGAALRAFVAKIPERPTSEQEFADCDAACKALKRAEETLIAAEGSALASMADVEKMRRAVGDLAKLAKQTRLATEKLVDARKDQIRLEEVNRGREAFAAHIAGLNTRLGRPFMPLIAHDFPGAIKGKRTIASLKDAIDGHLATLKIAANDAADKVQVNLNWLRDNAEPFKFLFSDVAAIVLKPHDDLVALATLRIEQHKAAEKAKEDAQRERIRAEEQARADREARERLEAEQRAAAIATTPAPTAAPAQPAAPSPIAASAIVSQAVAANSPMAAPAVVPIRAGTTSTPTLTLGAIGERLGFTVTAEFVGRMGLQGTRVRSAVLFHEHDYPKLLASISAHLRMLDEQYARQVA